MEQAAIKILDLHPIMSNATVRPDGWPQNEIVGYANEGFDIFLLISRSIQKFANVVHDDRVSMAVGEEPENLRELNAVYAGAHACEVTGPEQRDYAWRLLMTCHPDLGRFEPPRESETAIMRATCKCVSVVDFSQGFGHREELTIGGRAVAVEVAVLKDEWGSSAAESDDDKGLRSE